MRGIAQRVQDETLDEKEKEELNKKILSLATHVRELDRESKKYEFNI